MTKPPVTPSAQEQTIPLRVLNLTARAYNALRRAGIHTVEQLLLLSETELLDLPRLGAKSLADIQLKLTQYHTGVSRQGAAIAEREEERKASSLIPATATGDRKLVIEWASTQSSDKAPITLEEWEQYLRAQVGQVELLGELALTDQERITLGKFLGARGRGYKPKRAADVLRTDYPCALSVYLVAQGMYGYEGGDYWTGVMEVTGFEHQYTTRLGQVFEETLKALELPLFYDMRAEANRYVSLILAHGGIPNYCLPDFFSRMLQPSVLRTEYVDMSAADLIEEWGWQSSIRHFTDRPVIRFLTSGGQVAEDFVQRCRELAWTYLDTGVVPRAAEVGLPERVVTAYEAWIAEQDAAQMVRDTGERWRLRKPQVLVDPWGEGVLVAFPPQQVPATRLEACIEWEVRAEEQIVRMPVHVRRVGFDRKTEAEAFPLTHPVTSLEVTFLVDGEAKRRWYYQGLDEKRPLLVFDPERGTLLSWNRSLPAGILGLLYPANSALVIEGEKRQLEELPRLPWGWADFRGEIWDLTAATRLNLSRAGEKEVKVFLRPDEATRRPSLAGGQRLSLESSEERAPIYIGVPPHLRVPLSGRLPLEKELERWRLSVRNKWSAIPEVKVASTLAELMPALIVTENHVEVPLRLPSLLGEEAWGNFSVELRGPLGRDVAFTLRMLPHFVLCGHEELYLPAGREGSSPALLLIETRAGDRIESQGEESACRIDLIEREKSSWQYEVEVEPGVRDVELTVVHPHPREQDVRVPIHISLRRLSWALVDEESKARRGIWTERVIKHPIEAILQLQSPFLLVRLPLRQAETVEMELRLLNLEGEPRQTTGRVMLAKGRKFCRFDLSAFFDTLRASRSPVLRWELVIWGLPGEDGPYRLPVVSLTQTLAIADVQLASRQLRGQVLFDLTWREPVPLKNRRVRFWPLWRSWDLVQERAIPDEADGSLSLLIEPEDFRSGKYRLEFLVVDPWAAENQYPERPVLGAPSTADVELIPGDRQWEILNERIAQQGAQFEFILERAAVCQDLGAAEQAAADRQWCYQHLDAGTIPQQLALMDLVQAAEDENLAHPLRLKLFAVQRLKRLLTLQAANDIEKHQFDTYLSYLPQAETLPVVAYQQLLAVDDEPIRLRAVQQLIRRGNRVGPETVVSWVIKAKLSDTDATALLALNAAFSAEILKEELDHPAALRLLKALAPELGEKTPLVQVGTWVYTDAGWGRIEHIEDQAGTTVQQFLSGQTEYHLHATLRPAVDAEPVVIDLQRKLITFTDAEAIHTCSKCNGFSARDPHLIVERHDRIAHDGIGPSHRKEKTVRRSVRKLKYSLRLPLNQGLGILDKWDEIE